MTQPDYSDLPAILASGKVDPSDYHDYTFDVDFYLEEIYDGGVVVMRVPAEQVQAAEPARPAARPEPVHLAGLRVF